MWRAMTAQAAVAAYIPIGEATSEMLANRALLGSGAASRPAHPPSQVRLPSLASTIHQAPAPERAITKGLATPGLIAQVLVSKYCDHTPLYRQAQILARHGVRIERSTLAGWVGGACWWLAPLQARLAAHVFASTKLFADDTPLPVLDPGPVNPRGGRTRTGRLSRLCARRPPLGRAGTAGRRHLLQPRPQGGAAGGSS